MKKDRLLFINPSLRLNSPGKYLPVGVASVMTYFSQQGYHFDVLDIDINDMDDDKIEEYIKNNKYDIILSGSIVTHYKWMKWLTKTIKKHFPETVIIIGNSVGGSIPEVFLRNSDADIVVIGEGEFNSLEVVEAIQYDKPLGQIQGIAYLDKNGQFIQTSRRRACDVNSLPIVDWKFFDFENYFLKSLDAAGGKINKDISSMRSMPVSSARGCAFKCTFCHYVFWDDPYRPRSPQNILKEIERNIKEYGANYINFWDDLTFAGLQQAEEMADAILDSGLKFNWNAPVRVDLFGHPRNSYEKRLSVAQKLKDSGCLNLFFSLESGNQEILDMMNKRVKREYFTEQVKLLQGIGITCNTSVVFGYPLETKETIQETFDMCFEAGVYPSIGFLLPLPYTGMYEYAKKHGFIVDEDQYLNSITERQDFCLNMTSMEEQDIKDYINEEAIKLNQALQLNLDEEQLIKTGGYRRHTKETSKDSSYADQKPTANNSNLSYQSQTFELDLGLEKKEDSKSKE